MAFAIGTHETLVTADNLMMQQYLILFKYGNGAVMEKMAEQIPGHARCLRILARHKPSLFAIYQIL